MSSYCKLHKNWCYIFLACYPAGGLWMATFRPILLTHCCLTLWSFCNWTLCFSNSTVWRSLWIHCSSCKNQAKLWKYDKETITYQKIFLTVQGLIRFLRGSEIGAKWDSCSKSYLDSVIRIIFSAGNLKRLALGDGLIKNQWPFKPMKRSCFTYANYYVLGQIYNKICDATKNGIQLSKLMVLVLSFHQLSEVPDFTWQKHCWILGRKVVWQI